MGRNQSNTSKSRRSRLSRRKKNSSESRNDNHDASVERTNPPQPIPGPSLRSSSTLEPASRLSRRRRVDETHNRVYVSATSDSENEGTNTQQQSQPAKRLKRTHYIHSPDITEGHRTYQCKKPVIECTSGRKTDGNRIKTKRSYNASETVTSCTASDSQPQDMEVASEALPQLGDRCQSGASGDQSLLHSDLSNLPLSSSQLLRSGFGRNEDGTVAVALQLPRQCAELQQGHHHLSPYLDKAQARRIPVVTKPRKKKAPCTVTSAYSCSDSESQSQNVNVVVNCVESVSVENNPEELQEIMDILYDCGSHNIKNFDSVPHVNSNTKHTNGGEDFENEDGLTNEAESKLRGENVEDEALSDGDERNKEIGENQLQDSNQENQTEVDVVKDELQDSNMGNIEDIVEGESQDSNLANRGENEENEESQASDQGNIGNDEPFAPNDLENNEEDGNGEQHAIDQGNGAGGADDEEQEHNSNQEGNTRDGKGDNMEELHAADLPNKGDDDGEKWYDVEAEEQGDHPPHINRSSCCIL